MSETEKKIQEIVAGISVECIRIGIATEENAEIASELLLTLIQKNVVKMENGKLSELFIRLLEVVNRCHTCPSFDGQHIESLIFAKGLWKDRIQ